MKKFQLAFLLLLFAGSASAQFEDTKFVIGGAIDYNTDASTNASSLGIRPSFAKTIKANALIGISGGFYTTVSKSDNSSSKNTNNLFHAGVYYQRFHGIAGDIFFNWQVLAGMSFMNQEGNSSSYDGKGYDFSLLPGLSWKVMDKLILNASLGGASYSYQTNDSKSPGYSNSNKMSHLNIRFNNPQFGFTYLIK
ncbi:MAG: hypothetical protein RIG68_11110 [Imperialibacter sp.]|uniref:outer membrane beta-barrel protein n=1 Tax=Imperialibacter sp. TaxID=2038411 RepID=UPI0032EC5EFB